MMCFFFSFLFFLVYINAYVLTRSVTYNRHRTVVYERERSSFLSVLVLHHSSTSSEISQQKRNSIVGQRERDQERTKKNLLSLLMMVFSKHYYSLLPLSLHSLVSISLKKHSIEAANPLVCLTAT